MLHETKIYTLKNKYGLLITSANIQFIDNTMLVVLRADAVKKVRSWRFTFHSRAVTHGEGTEAEILRKRE